MYCPFSSLSSFILSKPSYISTYGVPHTLRNSVRQGDMELDSHIVSCCKCCIYRAITCTGSAGNETTSMRLSNNSTLKFNETEVFHEIKQTRRRRNRVGGGFPISCILVSSSMALVIVLVWGLELHFQFERFRRLIFPRALALGKILLGNFLVLCFRKACEFLRRNWLGLVAVGILVASGWPYGALLASIASSVYALIMLRWPRTY